MKMGKKTKKINNKKEIKFEQEPISETNEMQKLIKIILIVIVFFLVFYGGAVLITKNREQKPNSNNTNPTTIQYDEIILSQLLKKTPSEYYVLAISKEDGNAGLYDLYLTTYKRKENALKVYKANIDHPFNKPFIAQQSNFTLNSITDLKLKEVTLFKIKDGTIEQAYEGKDTIIEHLKSITKE